ncbi:glucose-1-phosphate adenylyltransferase subunit GlgD [Porcipelethomonas sp.]|uniref:glucose-1-phosphate adenylyltransferase subunit GlgD n=1 Tax=Porcipelethomonas sp. TaxID=2981675 RepID=UPI003EF9701D
MISKNNVLGLIFASMHDETVIDLTKKRTMGSIPFGGRYRLIDFPLSNMVNSGIKEVGVITKSNYGSLLDHLGSGREWDLSRKNGGLHLLPPFSHVDSGIYRGRLEALNGVWEFVDHSHADYVVMSDCDIVTTIDYRDVINFHIKNEADITVVTGKSFYDRSKEQSANVIGVDENNRITDVMIDPQISGECNISLDMFVVSKEFLRQIVVQSASRSKYNFTKDILQACKDEYKFMAYEHKGYFSKIDTMTDYYEANMALLDTENRNNLFIKSAPIYTKIRDNGPVRFGLESNIKNSLIADGCVIEGTVQNCVLCRGVKIGKDAVVKDCVLMQDTVVGNKCNISSVITDKNVEIGEGKILTGSSSYPLYIGKRAQI